MSHIHLPLSSGDIPEKNEQVALMGRIYRQCSQVRIWLGCDASGCNLYRQDKDDNQLGDDLHDPFELIRRFASGDHFYDWPEVVTSEIDGTHIFQNDAFEAVWQKHKRMIGFPWWTRLWTVQDTILPTAGLLAYDTWTIPLLSITKSGTYLETHPHNDCYRHAFGSLPESLRYSLIRQLLVFSQLRGTREIVAGFRSLHLYFSHRQCLDRRDTVHGFLGLLKVEAQSASLIPSYSASPASVFHEGTCRMMDENFELLWLILLGWNPVWSVNPQKEMGFVGL
jgi:hypothetical protein